MVKIHTADGHTHPLDLANPEQAQTWLQRLSRTDFQSTIHGVSLVERHLVRAECEACGATTQRSVGVQYSVTRPEELDSPFFHMEHVPSLGRIKGGERVTVFAGDIRLVVMAHQSQPAARISITRVGRQKFNPMKR